MNYNQKIDLVQKTKLFIGIDIAKHLHSISLRDQTGKEIGKPHMIANRRSDLNSLVSLTQNYNKNEVLVGMEPTGHYWKCIAYLLKEQGIKPVLVNSYHLHRTKEVMDNTKTKTDAKDSRLIGQMVREGKFLEPLLLTGAYADLRELTKTRSMISKDNTRTKIRLRALIDEYLPEYDSCFLDITCKTSLSFLKTFSLVILKSSLYKKEKMELLVKASRGKINIEKAEKIADTLANSIGVNEGATSVQLRLKILFEQLEFYQKQLAEIDTDIEEKLNQTEEYSILLSMRGAGVVTAAEFLGQTGPLKNFSNAKKLEKLAGLDLSENSSGKVQGKHSFSKRGRDTLRHALYKITVVAIAKDNELKRIYEYKINELKKVKMVAIGSLMVRVLRIIFGMAKNKTHYDRKKILTGLPNIK